MHVKPFLHKLLSNAIHHGRLKSLSEVVEAAIQTKQLNLTLLGRAIHLPIQERSGIQKVNRLFANEKLRCDYPVISKIITEKLIGCKKKPIIIVDWTKYPNSHDAIIRASLEIQGRAITLYEERHGEKNTGKREILKRFLMNLKAVLPATCYPIIITDAGFHNPWFKQITKLGWDFVGRIRGKKIYREMESDSFKPCRDLYKRATKQVKWLGKMVLTERNPLETNFYLIKMASKRRKAMASRGKWKSEQKSRNYAASHREPWLLVSSLSGRNAAKKVVLLYKKRMRIEEAFRDLKSSQYGFGLETNRTRKKLRRDSILLVAMLVNLVVILVGLAGEEMKLHYQFQSNSIKNRRILSIVYLGCQLIKKKIKIPLSLINRIFYSIQSKAIYEY